MATNHRIFTSFAIEDVRLRDSLVGQARSDKAPVSFVEVREEAVGRHLEYALPHQDRTMRRGIGIITSSTPGASGQLRELRPAYEEEIPVPLIYGYKDDRCPRLPEPVSGRRIYPWTWDNITAFPSKP
jgi:hypothetical protein